MNRRVVASIVITLLAIGVVAAIGFGAFQYGWQQGLVAGSDAEVITPVVHPAYGGWGYYGFGPLRFVFGLLFFFLIFGLIGRLFWRPWRGPFRHQGWGPPMGPEGPMEDHLTEWHRRAHQPDEKTGA